MFISPHHEVFGKSLIHNFYTCANKGSQSAWFSYNLKWARNKFFPAPMPFGLIGIAGFATTYITHFCILSYSPCHLEVSIWAKILSDFPRWLPAFPFLASPAIATPTISPVNLGVIVYFVHVNIKFFVSTGTVKNFFK
jgi:hypothetical protein